MPASVSSIPLTTQTGAVTTLSAFHGKTVMVVPFLTLCQDVCPFTTGNLLAVQQSIEAAQQNKNVAVIEYSVDPARDTPAVLKAYMENFDPGFLALRAPPEQLPALAKNFKIYYQKVEGRVPDSYTMDHSAGSYVYDTQGHLRLFARYGGGPAPMTSDIQTLLREAG